MLDVVDVIVEQTDVLHIGEVGEETRAGEDGSLLEKMLQVDGAFEKERAIGPEDWLCLILDTPARSEDAEVFVFEVYREGADWLADWTRRGNLVCSDSDCDMTRRVLGEDAGPNHVTYLAG
jgi:hypothetical protein